MHLKVTNIGVIEPSEILFEGLTNILLRKNSALSLFRLNDLEDYRKSIRNTGIDVIIIDALLIQNRVKQIKTLKGEHPEIRWIGLVHSLVSTEILNEFDTIIRIDDKTEEIFRKVLNRSVTNDKRDPSNQQKDLSSREIDVLKLLSEGLSNKEIADKLNVSIHTVISHRKSITGKTGIKSQSGLTIYAISNNIISLDTFIQ